MNQTIAQCLIDNAQLQGASDVDEDTYATVRTAYGHLMGEMPRDRALFDVGQLAYWMSAQLATPHWMAKAREYGFRY